MLKNQRVQALVEFAIAIILICIFIFGLITATLWGAASFLAQEIAHETAREYAVSDDETRAVNTGRNLINRFSIFIIPGATQVTVGQIENENKTTATVTVQPRIQKLFVFSLPSITRDSQATLEHYIRKKHDDDDDSYVQPSNPWFF